VEISEVDERRQVIPGTEQYFECDTLLLSCGLLPENELSKSAGVELHRVTGGPVVDEHFMTGIPGIFACGNVLHVHDLVDYVSDESANAGRAAAEWLAEGGKTESVAVSAGAAGSDTSDNEETIPVTCEGGVRYTVPTVLHKGALKEAVTVRFRVADVYRNRKLCIYYNEKQVMQIPKRVMAPGEMETCKLKPTDEDIASVRIVLED
jgi:pyruvate/2-oxoglutarate dehydrogenase complex dihydrolipoamide dehydrogenase (E3) component